MIQIRNISKIFRTHTSRHIVFSNASINFQRGINVGILGLNGSGKTTLLRLISGAILPNSGTITKSVRVSWTLGFGGGFHGSLTGRENLRFISRIYGADIKKVTRFVEGFTELGKFMDIPFRTYSSGMRAKLAFGLSMAIEFECYLIDEITAVGDASFNYKCQQALDERRSRANVIVVSHNPQTILKMCDTVAVIHKNALVPFDSMQEGVEFYNDTYIQSKHNLSSLENL